MVFLIVRGIALYWNQKTLPSRFFIVFSFDKTHF